MKDKIIEIIGFGMEPERAELKADEIIKLFESQCPLCQSCTSPKIRICKEHQWELEHQIELLTTN
jgi:Zn-dependent alcohol dehydrogenase